jgi:hypothetical protein
MMMGMIIPFGSKSGGLLQPADADQSFKFVGHSAFDICLLLLRTRAAGLRSISFVRGTGQGRNRTQPEA